MGAGRILPGLSCRNDRNPALVGRRAQGCHGDLETFDLDRGATDLGGLHDEGRRIVTGCLQGALGLVGCAVTPAAAGTIWPVAADLGGAGGDARAGGI